MLEILEALHHLDLGSESVTVVLHSQAYDLVDRQPDPLCLHIHLIFGHIVGRTSHAAENKLEKEQM